MANKCRKIKTTTHSTVRNKHTSIEITMRVKHVWINQRGVISHRETAKKPTTCSASVLALSRYIHVALGNHTFW